MADEDWDDDRPLEDWEYPDEEDEGEQATTTICPHCRGEIYDDAVQCPQCGEYITGGTSAGSWPWWVYVGVIGALLATALALFSIC